MYRCNGLLFSFFFVLIQPLFCRHWLREDYCRTASEFCTRSRALHGKLSCNDGDLGSYRRTSTDTRTRFDKKKDR